MDTGTTVGAVVVTRFQCPSLLSLLIVWTMHRRLRPDVKRLATGFVTACASVRWRERTLLNISFWEDVESIRSMGQVTRHVDATRVPARLGVSTRGEVFTLSGDWRQVLFDTTRQTP